jgi:hypothetical protein
MTEEDCGEGESWWEVSSEWRDPNRRTAASAAAKAAGS